MVVCAKPNGDHLSDRCCPPATSPLRTGLSSVIDSLLPLGHSHGVLHRPALLPPTDTDLVLSVACHRSLLLFWVLWVEAHPPKLKQEPRVWGMPFLGHCTVSANRPSSSVQVLRSLVLLYSWTAAKYILNGPLSNRGHFWK